MIGGGAAGIAALRQMLSRGLDATLFERADDVGGLWNYDDPRASKVFNGVVQNVTKRHNRFSGHAAPARWPLYLGHAHTLEYLRSYAKKHNLMRHVRTRREVTSCERRPDGRFEVRHRATSPLGSVARRDASPSSVLSRVDASPSSVLSRVEGEIRTDDANDAAANAISTAAAVRETGETGETVDAFDAVCVCTGQLSRPNVPRVPGLETFRDASRTSEYRVPSDFAGARVLIVGTGAASGSDIAQDLCGCAASVTVSVRTERWIISRGYLAGRPTWLLRASARVPAWLGVLLTLYADWIPYLRRLSPGMTDSKDFLNAVALGRVSLAKTVRSVSGSTVSFADGASADFDVVVFATGFARDVPFIHRSLRPETRGLYKGALVPSEPRVGYCLFVLPFGSHFQVAELQAAWLAEVWSGGLPTPSVADMLRLAGASRSSPRTLNSASITGCSTCVVKPAGVSAGSVGEGRIQSGFSRGVGEVRGPGVRVGSGGAREGRERSGGRWGGTVDAMEGFRFARWDTTTKPTRRSKVAVVVAGVTTAAA